MSGLFLSCFAVLSVIVAGLALRNKQVNGSSRIYATVACASMALVVTGAVIALFSGTSLAAEGAEAVKEISVGMGMGFIAAALSTALACLASAYAVASVGSSAIGLVGEKPEMLGTTLIYLGLSEGIAIYGIIVSLLIIQKL